jgi:hypothetical protein
MGRLETKQQREARKAKNLARNVDENAEELKALPRGFVPRSRKKRRALRAIRRKP